MNYDSVDSFCSDMESVFSEFRWPYKSVSMYENNGLPDSIGEIGGEMSLSKADVTVSQLLDAYIPQCLQDYFEEIELDSGHSRQYPDIDLSGSGLPESPIALDVKTALVDADNPERLNSAISVGTHGRYFNNPRSNPAGIKRPYSSYEYHILLIFVYNLHDNYTRNEKRYVDDIQVVCDKKWKFATKQSESGTRNYIASPRTVAGLIDREGEFDSRESFQTYWREPVGEDLIKNKQSGLSNW